MFFVKQIFKYYSKFLFVNSQIIEQYNRRSISEWANRAASHGGY